MYSKLPLCVAVPEGIVRGHVYMPNDHEAMARYPLVMAHGGPGGSSHTMEAFLKPLAARRPVVFYDQLGSYLSPAIINDALMEPQRFGEEALRVIDHLGFEKVFFLGHSWGGVVALELSNLAQGRIAGLILSSPLISTSQWIQDAQNLLAALPVDIQDDIRIHEAAGTTQDSAYKRAVDVFMDRHYCRMHPYPAAMEAGNKQLNIKLYNTMWGISEFSCTGTLQNYDGTRYLKALSMPVLLTCGRHDEARPASLYHFAKAIKQADVHVFEQSAHIAYVEETKSYMDVLQDFMSKVEGLSGA